MKFDNAGLLEEVVWNSRIADLPRSELRTILQRLYGGEPPFDNEECEDQGVDINRNNLTGVNLLAQARRQWNSAFLSTKNFFNVVLDSGPVNKRQEWNGIITKNANRRLKRNGKMREQIRATGGNVMLHGIGPVVWPDRRSVIPDAIPLSSLLIPSETYISFENLEWFAVFREWTPSQLYQMTFGPKRDPGWNMDVVKGQLKYVAEQVQKQPNATAYQYMPERIEELFKQDLGFWGSDAVPTVDIWDVYFREAEDGKGWYRRILLDWGIGDSEMRTYKNGGGRPPTKNPKFIYTSEDRKYSNSLSEILHCQFGDCSPYFPNTYHATRSLGWMLWGPCDLDNRLYCKVMQNVFMNQMWWFRVAGESAMQRIKKADFFHLGVIPNGVSFIPSTDRFQPDPRLTQLGIDWNSRLMAQNSASYTQDFNKGESGKEMTATETMARVNEVNAMVSGMLTLAYDYETNKYREICRRLCIPNNPDRDAKEFRKACLKEGVPAEYLDVDRWEISPERVMGGGNKTLEMAVVNGLNAVRKNFGPQGQRIIDHMTVFSYTDQPDLADEIAPLDEIKTPSNSMHDAELATERLMAGLPFRDKADMVYEDYVVTWLHDMTTIVSQIQQSGGVGTPDKIMGLNNMAGQVQKFIMIIAQNEEEKPKVKQYETALHQIMQLVKGFTQRMQQAQKAQGNGAMSETQSKIQARMLEAQSKTQLGQARSSQRMAMDQARFEEEQKREDRRTNAEIRRKNMEAAHDLKAKQADTMLDMAKKRFTSVQE